MSQLLLSTFYFSSCEQDGAVARIAAAANMQVAAVVALATGGLVKVKADGLGMVRLSVGVSGRTVVLNMVWT